MVQSPLAFFTQLGLSHVKPVSTWQVLEQPSPLRKLPSSHCSLPSTMPSPQVDVQAEPGAHAGSAWHVPEQPSKGTALPSSQLSAPSFLPSPQTVAVQALGWPPHLNPSSIRQRASQP